MSSSGSPGAPPRSGVLRAVMVGRPSLCLPGVLITHPQPAGRRSPVNRMTAWHHAEIRAALTVGAIVTATTYGALPHWEYSSHFPRKCVVV